LALRQPGSLREGTRPNPLFNGGRAVAKKTVKKTAKKAAPKKAAKKAAPKKTAKKKK